MSEILAKEDYEEPCCPFQMPGARGSLPIPRIMEKLDGYLDKDDYLSAERHLNYWMSEAKSLGDIRGELTLLNEEIGLFRKTAQKEKGLAAVNDALLLVSAEEFSNTVTAGTTYLNAATAYKAFGDAEAALTLYRKAEAVYNKNLRPGDILFGGLYNNTALALCDNGDYAGARDYYEKALAVMEKAENGDFEKAITYCNLADLAVAEKGEEAAEKAVADNLDRAYACLTSPSLPRNGYYAFVAEKCISVFAYYGYFLAEAALKDEVKKIRVRQREGT